MIETKIDHLKYIMTIKLTYKGVNGKPQKPTLMSAFLLQAKLFDAKNTNTKYVYFDNFKNIETEIKNKLHYFKLSYKH